MCFPSNLSCSYFEGDSEQSFFGEVGELAEVAPYDDSFEPLATEEEAVSNNASMDQEAEKISQLSIIPNHKR